MEPGIRLARPEDAEAIAGFTTATFSWGDYVGEEFPDWLAQTDAAVPVAVDGDDTAVAIARVRMLGPREGWLSAARVHPEWRRRGLGSSLNDWCVRWVAERGGLVCRLQTEDDNEPARQQVSRLGYRSVLHVVNAERPTRLPPETNGFPRPSAPERLQRAPKAEADLAFIAWSSSELARQSRAMFATEPWAWRRLTEHDLRSGELWSGPSGWVLATDGEDGFLDVRWLMCAPEDLDRLVSAVVDVAERTGKNGVAVALARTEWTVEALTRCGFVARHPSVIYEKPVT